MNQLRELTVKHIQIHEEDSQIKLYAMSKEKEELTDRLESIRKERDNAIGERFLLHTNTQEHPAYKELVRTARDLEAKLMQSKLQQAQIKASIDNLTDELAVTNDLIEKKKLSILNYQKEYQKIAKQRDVVNEKLLKGERVNASPAVNKSKPPLSMRSSMIPKFISNLYSTPPASSRNISHLSKESLIKISNVKVE